MRRVKRESRTRNRAVLASTRQETPETNKKVSFVDMELISGCRFLLLSFCFLSPFPRLRVYRAMHSGANKRLYESVLERQHVP